MSFWTHFENVLGSSAAVTASSEDEQFRLALALLLVEIARADDHEHPGEFDVVTRVVQEHLDLSVEDVEDLLDAARQERDAAISFEPHIRIINHRLDQPQKKRLMTRLWEVAYADGELHKYEEHLMRRFADLLHLSHADFIRSKLEVQALRGD